MKTMLRLSILFSCLMVAANAGAQTFNPVLAGTLSDNQGGALLDYGMDIAVDGDYAYVAAYGENALEIINITNPRNPMHAAAIVDGTGGASLVQPQSVFVKNGFAYVGNTNGLEIVDVSNPFNPQHVSYLAGNIGSPSHLILCHDLYVDDSYAYVVTSSTFEIIDISNPASPARAGVAYAGVGGATLADPFAIAVSGNFAYIATNLGQRIEIFDIGDPADPTFVGALVNGQGGAVLAQPTGIAVSGNYAYVADTGNSGAFEIVNISNPTNPIHVAAVTNLGVLHSVNLWGNYAFVNHDAGFFVFDITNPASPQLITNTAPDYDGCFCYAPSPRSLSIVDDYAYLPAFIPGGLSVISLRTPFAPSVSFPSVTNNSSFTANWFGNAPSTSYYLDVSTSSNFSSLLPGYNNLAVGNVSNYLVTGLSSATTYYYRVRVVNSFGTSSNSATQSALTLPASPTATSGGGQTGNSFTATWASTAGATGYFLDVSTSSSFNTFLSGYSNRSVGQVSSAVVSNAGLTAGTTYYYRVRAGNASGQSENSNTIAITTAPSIPVALAVSAVTSNTATASWTASATATHYFVELSSDGFANVSQQIVTSDHTEYTFQGLQAGTSYQYRVKAFALPGTTDPSNVISFLTAPATPVIQASATVGTTSFNLTWSASNTATEYFLDVSTDQTFGSFVAGMADLSVGNVTSYEVTGVDANTRYFYRIRAINAFGSSEKSDGASVVTLPLVPVALEAILVTSSSFAARWQPVQDMSYRIDVSTSMDFSTFVPGYENLLTSAEGDLQITSGISPATLYFYRLRANNSGGISASSDVIAVLTTPEALTATDIGVASFTAQWQPGGDGVGFFLDVSTTEDFTSLVSGYDNLDVGAVSSYEINNGIAGNATYYYRIKAIASDVSSTYSNVIPVSTGQLKLSQAITFEALPSKKVSDVFFDLEATASSQLTVSFKSSNPSVASIMNGNRVVITSRGVTTITASQEGNDDYDAAEDVLQELEIVNSSPIVVTPVAKKDLEAGKDFSFQLDADVFFDSDHDDLTYSATLVNGDALPSWLVFTASSRTFSGTAPASGQVNVRVIADDGFGGAVSTTFIVNALPVTGLEDQSLVSATIYPNPVDRFLFIEANSENLSASIYAITGELLVQRTCTNAVDQIDLSNYAPGFYLVRLRSSRGERVIKIVKR